MAEARRSYLFVPAGGAGEGMGHLVRCFTLSRQLGARPTFFTRHMDRAATRLLADRLSESTVRPRPIVLNRLPHGKRWDLIVVDARRTSADELDELMARGLVVCIDEGGAARDLAPFTIDALPVVSTKSESNLSDRSFLILPPRVRRAPPTSLKRILVSLGGEDHEHLGERLVRSMLEERVCAVDGLTVVEGPLASPRDWPAGVRIVQGIKGIARLMSAHDVLITHFGMTAFEALAAGVPAILFNPSRYHERLGKAAGFPMIGIGTPRIDRLKKLLRDPVALGALVQRFNENLGTDRRRKLALVLRQLCRTGTAECPVCGKAFNRTIARFADRTYRRCSRCGTVSLESFAGSRKEYDTRYFFAEYKAQYGRTYLEDFEAIRKASLNRVTIIRRLLRGKTSGTVLDVGCAYGPFLAALGDAGLSAFGIDVSSAAIAHVRRNLRVPCLCAGFEEVEKKRLPRHIAAITLWYVLEHFIDTARVLAKASALLPKGGVLAFSTPNGRGISARRDLRRFLMNSPADHFVILSPHSLRNVLSPYGLSLRRIRITGHHPERFPGLLGRAAVRWTVAGWALRVVSVCLRLGDTFEAYAVKGET